MLSSTPCNSSRVETDIYLCKRCLSKSTNPRQRVRCTLTCFCLCHFHASASKWIAVCHT